MQLCEQERNPPLEYIIVDTPGQIEVFTWSASGSIVTELFASSFPTIVIFVVDTVRCVQPRTFMSNMLQACSILYKTRLPLLLVISGLRCGGGVRGVRSRRSTRRTCKSMSLRWSG